MTNMSPKYFFFHMKPIENLYKPLDLQYGDSFFYILQYAILPKKEYMYLKIK